MPRQAKSVPEVENDLGDGKLLASAIRDVADSAKKLLGGSLKMNAIVTLIHADTGVAKRSIIDVLQSASELDRHYLK